MGISIYTFKKIKKNKRITIAKNDKIAIVANGGIGIAIVNIEKAENPENIYLWMNR